MKEHEYKLAQEQVLLVAGMVENIELEKMLECMSMADAAGPVVDPTLYRQAAGNMALLRRLAELLLAVKNEVKRQRGAELRKPGRIPGLSEALKLGPVELSVPGSPLDQLPKASSE